MAPKARCYEHITGQKDMSPPKSNLLDRLILEKTHRVYSALMVKA